MLICHPLPYIFGRRGADHGGTPNPECHMPALLSHTTVQAHILKPRLIHIKFLPSPNQSILGTWVLEVYINILPKYDVSSSICHSSRVTLSQIRVNFNIVEEC